MLMHECMINRNKSRKMRENTPKERKRERKETCKPCEMTAYFSDIDCLQCVKLLPLK